MSAGAIRILSTRRTHSVELLICAALAGSVASLLLAFGPAPGDAAVHLYRTYLVQRGTLLWDNYWYEGDFPLASYSLLYYLPAAVVGNLPLVVGGVIASTLLFASIIRREWGDAALWPSRLFGVFAAAPLFTGLYSYSLGFATLLGTIRALQSRRTGLAVALAGLTLGFSPLSFAFLCLILGSLLVARRRITAATVQVAVGIAGLVAFEMLVLRAFPSGGVYPFHLVDLASLLAVCAVGALLARRATGGAPILAFFVLWAISGVAACVVATPIGGNWSRLHEVVFPVMLLTAFLARFRPRGLVGLALAGSFAYSVVPSLMLVPYRLDGRPETKAFWQPALSYLDTHAHRGFRVEVVPTSSHWESYWIPRNGYPIARGWYRQLDMVDNPVLYSSRLDGPSYAEWLRSVAIEYVLLPATKLDPVGGPTEERLLRSGTVPGLREVYRDSMWTIYRLAAPTPLLTGSGVGRIDLFDHTRIGGVVEQPGRYLLRVHFIPFWKRTPGVCVSRTPSGMTFLDVSSPGRFLLSVPSGGAGLVKAAAGGDACGAAPELG